MHNIQEIEEREYQDGVEYTRYLIGRKEALDAAPVFGEEGWSEELEAERKALYELLG